MTLRRWIEPFAEIAPADVVVEAFGCGLPPGYVAAMARLAVAARVVHPRILERRAMGRRRAWSRLAAPAALAPAPLLVSRIHRAGPAACSASAAFSTRARHSGATTRRNARCGPRSAFRAPAADEIRDIALLLSESRAAGALRCVVRRRRDDRVSRARRRCGRRARSLDRRQRTAPRPSVASRPPDAAHAFRSSPRTSTTGCSGRRPSISCAARTRSCARNGRRAPSRGTSIRRRRARIGRSSMRSSIATRPGSTRRSDAAVRRFWRAWNGAADAGPIDAAWARFLQALPVLERHADRWATHLVDPARPRGRAGQGGLASGIIKSFPNQPSFPLEPIPATQVQ